MSGVNLAIGIVDVIMNNLYNRKKLSNEIIDSDKNIIYFSNGKWKEQVFVHEKEND